MHIPPNSIPPNKIGFDFDCVIADTAATFLQILCRKHGFCGYSLEDITDFEVTHCLDVPKELAVNIFLGLEENPLPIPPVAGAVAVLKKMAEKCRPVIITARTESRPVEEWLQHYLPDIGSGRFQIAASGDPDEKRSHIQEYGLDYFVDDRAETCEALQEDIIPLIFDRPWNRKNKTTALQRVMSWQDIDKLLIW